VKRNYGGHGGDWTWRIEAETSPGVKLEQAVTFLVYFATDGDGKLNPEIIDRPNGPELTEISGQTSTLKDFKITFNDIKSSDIDYFSYTDYLNSLTDIHNDAMRRIGGKYVNVGTREKLPRYMFGPEL